MNLNAPTGPRADAVRRRIRDSLRVKEALLADYLDRKSTRLNSTHRHISYTLFFF